MVGKVWWKSWTIWFNGLLAAAKVFFETVGQPVDPALFDGILVMGLAIGNLALRFKTKEPVTK